MHVFLLFIHGIPVTDGDSWDKFLITCYLFLLYSIPVTWIFRYLP